jgi:hypothetical protein
MTVLINLTELNFESIQNDLMKKIDFNLCVCNKQINSLIYQLYSNRSILPIFDHLENIE